jgi:hypothetical protein
MRRSGTICSACGKYVRVLETVGRWIVAWHGTDSRPRGPITNKGMCPGALREAFSEPEEMHP